MAKCINDNVLGPHETQEVIDGQDNKCYLCKAHGHLLIDHNHSGKGPRVALCQHCMLMLGHSKSDPKTLMAGAEYLTNIH